jgi:hypothetical protein
LDQLLGNVLAFPLLQLGVGECFHWRSCFFKEAIAADTVHQFWVKNRGTSMIYKVDQRNINDPPSRSWNVEVEGWVQSIFVWHVRHVDNWGVVSNQTGWWFGTFVIFPYIWKFIIPTDSHISQKGRSTTNQQSLGDCLIVWSHGPGGGSSKTQNPWTCCKEADFSMTK